LQTSTRPIIRPSVCFPPAATSLPLRSMRYVVHSPNYEVKITSIAPHRTSSTRAPERETCCASTHASTPKAVRKCCSKADQETTTPVLSIA
jgi:hypothetical protein